MNMAAINSSIKLFVKAAFIFFFCFCKTTSSQSLSYLCNEIKSQNQCETYAVLHTNRYYSSLYNLSFYLGIDRFSIGEANGVSPKTEFLLENQPLLIPITCKCTSNYSFEAELTKTAIKGESFDGIAESLEGLTSCKAIKEKNPSVSSWVFEDKVKLLIPLICACPSSHQLNQNIKLLVSYPVSVGDTVHSLALKFNTTPEAIISANTNISEHLVPFSSLLIPQTKKPNFLSQPSEPSLGFQSSSIPVISAQKKSSKMWNIGVCIAVIGVTVGAGMTIGAAFLFIQWRKKMNKQSSLSKMEDYELQHLNLSVRTTSEKKVSFENSQDPLDIHFLDMTPRKMMVERYTMEELRRATEDFNPSNLIEGTVFHGRLNGKNLAIKRTKTEDISKINFGILLHHHPNIIRLMGVCPIDGPDSFLVLDYAKNGSLKDWIHGGLALKSQFIASCYCFLNWKQRLRICLDVATALQYMHHIMNPIYIHKNIKSRNIFLDEEFNAKVGNFGIRNEGNDENSEGCLAPEYAKQGIISSSTDIFAYGLVLLEVLSGKRPGRAEGSVWLVENIKLILESENEEELRGWMDDALGEDYSFDAAVTLANLARACVEEEPSSRPTAGEIVEKLLKLVEETGEGEQFLVYESSCKPLVQAAANNMRK